MDQPATRALVAYEVHQRRRNLSPETVRRRRIVLAAFGRWLDRDVLSASREDIEGWMDLQPQSPWTQRAYGGDLRAFYQWATREDHVAVDPSLRLTRPLLPRSVPRPIPDADLELALAQAKPRLAAMLALAALQGLRVKEIAGLRGQDVDVVRGKLIVTHGKGHRQRVLPLNDEALARLRRAGLPAVGYVFTNPHGCPLRPATVSALISSHLRRLGIEATAHQLRHWFATTTYRASGGDLRLVQDLLGHASPQTTAAYTQWDDDRADDVVRALRVGPTPSDPAVYP